MYKKFKMGIITQDAETGIFSGTVDNIPDYVYFEGKSMKELEDNFQKAVDNYITNCERVGKEINV